MGSDSMADPDIYQKPFVETQISFRTDTVEGSIDTTVLDQVLKKINLSEFADLPLPALFNKIKSKMKEKQNRQEMQRKYKKMRMDKLTQKEKENENDQNENKRLEKQQKRRQKLLKEKKSKLDTQILADDVLLNNQI